MDADFAANPDRVHDDRKHRLNFPRALHNRLPGYAPTPLLDMSDLAADLGLRRLWLKDESSRLGLQSYEILGATWALYREVMARLGRRPARWDTIEELRERIAPACALRIVVVSDNNFAIAAARAARWLGFECVAYVPGTAAAARLVAIEREGSTVDAEAVSYDEALARAARQTAPEVVVLSDSSWHGFTEIPGWVTDGYTTVFEEVDEELESRGARVPDAVFVPLGTGALAAAAGNYYRVEPGLTATGKIRRFPPDLRLIGVEPAEARCFIESIRAHRRVALPAAAPSVMDSLARGLPSPLAWEVVRRTFDGFIAVTDAHALAASHVLRDHGIWVNASGAAAFAGLVDGLTRRSDWGLDLGSRSEVLVVCTEGPLVGD
ncbi:MAG: pyridoxal-phosphate dependent enzyme [Acidimicrobiales bacterium]|nr:pyridoxal-phosphate dependent enzyme [Acidimicrobiales bacterium]